MIPRSDHLLMRVSLTLDPIDVDLLDRLGKLEGRNRSQEMRGILEHLRPMLRSTIEAFEVALAQRDAFNEAAASAAISGLKQLLPEAQHLARQYMGSLARLEGAAAVAADPEAPASNTGATN